MRAVQGVAAAAVGARLETIDALRGAAALAVVLHHVFFDYVLKSPFGVLAPLFWLGSTGVWLFIVISGFCIHLRFAKTLASGRPESPAFIPFWKRRLRRLYPAYFAALLLYVVLRSLEGSVALDRAFAYDFTLHALLIHNLDPGTVFGFCGVFWTLALEEHLYLAYFLLLAMRKRWGWATTLLLCLGARAGGLMVHWAVKNYWGWESAFQSLFVAQWFVWALGALSVEAYFGVVTLPRWCSSRWFAICLLGLTAFVITVERGNQLPIPVSRIWWAVRDPVMGLGFFVLINSLLLRSEAAARVPASPPRALAALGVFSYSLYLVHQAIQLHLFPMALRALGTPPQAWMAPFVVALCILFARAFFQVFERPFLSASRMAER